MRWRFWTLWTLGNIAWVIGVPALFGYWLYDEVQSEYASGARISTDGDSISIPIFGVAVLNLLLVILVNVAWAVYAYVKQRRVT